MFNLPCRYIESPFGNDFIFLRAKSIKPNLLKGLYITKLYYNMQIYIIFTREKKFFLA